MRKKDKKRIIGVSVIVLIFAVLFSLLFTIDYLFGYGIRAFRGVDQGQPYPIIFIHGHSSGPIDHKLMAEGFLEDGIISEDKGVFSTDDITAFCQGGWPADSAVDFEYYNDDQNKGIPSYASKLDEVVDFILRCSGSEKVILIGHSMGCIVAREFGRKEGYSKIDKIICTEGPNYGSPIASFIFLGDAGQLRPKGPFLKRLNSNEEECAFRGRIMNVASRELFENLLIRKVREQRDLDVCKSPSAESIVAPVETAFLANSINVEGVGCVHGTAGVIETPSVTSPKCEWAYDEIVGFIRE
ncbi:esterase/lipase family protein [Nanoarchaeota archaeon]